MPLDPDFALARLSCNLLLMSNSNCQFDWTFGRFGIVGELVPAQEEPRLSSSLAA